MEGRIRSFALRLRRTGSRTDSSVSRYSARALRSQPPYFLHCVSQMAEARTNPRGDVLKEKLIPNQSVSTLMGRSRAGQNFMSLIPKTKQLRRVGMIDFVNHSNLFIFNKLAERVGFEFTRKRSFNNIERTAGNVKQWKAVVSSTNGSQTDHGVSDHLKCAERR